MAILAQIQRHAAAWQLFTAWPAVLSMWSKPLLKKLAWALTLVCALAFGGELISGYAEYKGYITPEISSWFRVSKDRSLGEFAGYIIQEISLLMILFAGIKLASPIHYALAGLLQFVCLDDSFQFHENYGEVLGTRFFQDGDIVRAQDMGELSYFIIVMAVGGLALLWGYVKSTPYQRSLFLMLLMPFLMIAGCSVGLDLLHANVPHANRLLGGLVATVEDGGELIAFSLLMLVSIAQWLVVSTAVVTPTMIKNRLRTTISSDRF